MNVLRACVLPLFLCVLDCKIEQGMGTSPEPMCEQCTVTDECVECDGAPYCGCELEHLDQCTQSAFCPAPLHPIFCAGSPPWSSSVQVAAAVCDETVAVWCTTENGEPLGAEWYCQVDPSGANGDATGCPPAGPCVQAACGLLAGQPDPHGLPGKCTYNLLPHGAPCDVNAVCISGACAAAQP